MTDILNVMFSSSFSSVLHMLIILVSACDIGIFGQTSDKNILLSKHQRFYSYHVLINRTILQLDNHQHDNRYIIQEMFIVILFPIQNNFLLFRRKTQSFENVFIYY